MFLKQPLVNNVKTLKNNINQKYLNSRMQSVAYQPRCAVPNTHFAVLENQFPKKTQPKKTFYYKYKIT